MDDTNKTDSRDPNLTSENDSGESTDTGAGLDTKKSDEGDFPEASKAGFQKALQKDREEKKKLQEELEAARREKADIQKRLKEQELAKLDKEERLEIENRELAEKNAKLELRTLITQEVGRRGLDMDDPLIELIMDSPWSIPAVRNIIGDSEMTWDEVISLVREKLPPYLDSLADRRKDVESTENTENESETTSEHVDTERAPGDVPKRTWSRREIDALSITEYEKHKPEIDLAAVEGRIVD